MGVTDQTPGNADSPYILPKGLFIMVWLQWVIIGLGMAWTFIRLGE